MEPTVESPVMLRERAYQEIKRLLLTSHSAEEPFLSQRKLARRLGIGHTPVRSAVERLETEGLVLISPQQGISVRELSPREIAEHFELRQALEPYTLRRLAGRFADSQLKEMEINLDAQARATASMDIPRIIVLDAEFHLLLCSFLDNREIFRTMLQLRDKVQRVILRMARVSPERFSASYQEHLAIFEAARDGDTDAAAAAMYDHLERGKQKLAPAGAW